MTQNYTLCEIKENNGRNGKPVWIIVKGIVYDVTKFIKEHPGGEDLILEYAGKDATKAFNDVGHSIDAIHDMKLYKIGVVDNECSQQCQTVTTESKTHTQSTTEQNCQRQKKRMKFFFCF
ncbi:cytochrome b5 [Stomoxys calcitrans]|uniref:Cytochrome b5 heme-binding domain-containing protein n=1 Tax=Stomoxys calcitrans TaxID=35570 RepID=A0A1I8NRM4_STOCA|nr:cytochrome b5 [Stomoxys calcitrans]